MKSFNRKFSENIILGIGIVILFFLLLLPESRDPWEANIQSQECVLLSPLPALSCKLYIGLRVNYDVMQGASLALKGKAEPSDIAQDIVGFRALVNQQNPYPILGPEYRKLGLEGELGIASTHPPTAFLFLAPLAFLPWSWASALWAWFMLALIVLTFRYYGLSWKLAIGLTPIALLWPPVATSLGQLTVIWLFALVAGYYYEKRQNFWSGVMIGLAAITKFFPGILVLSFLLKRKWLALLGFLATFWASIIALLILHPGSILRYIEVNQINSKDVILHPNNLSLLINSYRFGGWVAVAMVLILFLSIIWTNRKFLYAPLLFSSSRLWILLSYFSVALLPIAWPYSLTPLLPVVIMLISQKKLSVLTIGFSCLIIPIIFPSFGTAIPFAAVILLIGLGLLIDGLPFKIFTAVSLQDFIRPSQIENE